MYNLRLIKTSFVKLVFLRLPSSLLKISLFNKYYLFKNSNLKKLVLIKGRLLKCEQNPSRTHKVLSELPYLMRWKLLEIRKSCLPKTPFLGYGAEKGKERQIWSYKWPVTITANNLQNILAEFASLVYHTLNYFPFFSNFLHRFWPKFLFFRVILKTLEFFIIKFPRSVL